MLTDAWYRLQIRNILAHFYEVLRCRRLTQQYECDTFAIAESCRLRFVCTHQKEIKAEAYHNLMDSIGQDDAANAGLTVILPSSITGSPRWYANAFQDSMVVVRAMGTPHLFITMTCNPSWPSISDSTFSGGSSSDRPDLEVQVFHIKMMSLLDDLTKKHVLGKVKAHFAMVEFQKRGLPHIHILLILEDEDVPRTPKDVDKIISAEIPDPIANPRLHKTIVRCNLHGPCGKDHRSSPCMKGVGQELKCEKCFPKDFQRHTTVNAESHPTYRRRSPSNGGRRYQANPNMFIFDNRWTVSYSPFLSMTYDCHINVEVVFTVQSVKYLYKYLTKGSDRTVMKLANGTEVDISRDEVTRYHDARFIGSTEACWRHFDFALRDSYSPVEKLPLHLENQQSVLFQAGEAAHAAANGPPEIKLTAFFKLNQEYDEPVQIIYPDVYKYFTWNRTQWMARKQNRSRNNRHNPNSELLSDTVGRIPTINLSARNSELYFLRMLLHHVMAPTSYEHIKTYAGMVHPTFQAACLARCLLEDDSEIDKCMEEAATIKFGLPLREFFPMLLIWMTPADPLAFWERHKKVLLEDLMRKHHLQTHTDPVVHLALSEIQSLVRRHGLDIADTFKLPRPDATIIAQLTEARVVQ